MADSATCRIQKVEAFNMDQAARAILPEAMAPRACDSKSDAARAKAEDGHLESRSRCGAASVRI
eukprot:5560912-Pleurochrysis_carterae.AAC.1